MQLKIKPHKTEEITYLEKNKQHTKYHLKYLDVSK